jgi:hypothetical protein
MASRELAAGLFAAPTVYTETAVINFSNDGSGNSQTSLVQFGLPDPMPTRGSRWRLSPVLVFNHAASPRPGVHLSVRDDFTPTARPASFNSFDIPSPWAVNWREAHYSDIQLGTVPPPGSRRIALTARLSVLGGNDSGRTSLLRLAYQVIWLAFLTPPDGDALRDPRDMAKAGFPEP